MHRALATLPFLLFALLAAPAPTAGCDERVRLADVTGGSLLLQQDEAWRPLPQVSADVEATITGGLARIRIAQTFRHEESGPIDVVYAFPLPELAAVHGMEIRIGDRVIRSEVQEREEARRTYERAREEGRRAALVEQDRPNLFRTSVANVVPSENIAVVLDLLVPVDRMDGRSTLRLPFAITPRYGGAVTAPAAPAESAASIGPEPADPALPGVDDTCGWDAAPATASLVVRLQPVLLPDEVTSPTHPIDTARRQDVWEIRATPPFAADREFELVWTTPARATPTVRALAAAFDGRRYATVEIFPPDGGSTPGLAADTLFVVDVSGSMAGASIRQARRALVRAIERLRPDDRFDVLAFSDKLQWLDGSFPFADAASVRRAVSWVDSLAAHGGTEIELALLEGLRGLGDMRSSRAARVVFITDGAISHETEVLQRVVREAGRTRVHALGIGHAPNGYFIRKLAQRGRGTFEFIHDVSDVESRLDSFLGRLERPVARDLELEWLDGTAAEVYPARLPDLHVGDPLRLAVRLDSGADMPRLKLRGWTEDGPFERVVTIDRQAMDSAAIATRWARAKVESLQDSLHDGAPPESVRREVLEVALRFGLVTPYTSRVAVDRHETVDAAGRVVRLRAALPVGGTDGPLRRRLAAICLVLAAAIALAVRRW